MRPSATYLTLSTHNVPFPHPLQLMQMKGRPMAGVDEFVQANEEFAGRFDQGGLPMPPARNVAVLTCMDARLHPSRLLDLAIGDAHVIRNAGGRASDDAIRSLIISSRLLGTREFVVIH